MKESKNLWGGRFTEGPNETFAEFNNSFRFDRRLFAADVRASIAHANGLATAGVLTAEEKGSIAGALGSLLGRAADVAFFESDAEDVHSFIEAKLVALVGDTGKKLHTGRSRNDQVATALRRFVQREGRAIVDATVGLQSVLVARAEEAGIGVYLLGNIQLGQVQFALLAVLATLIGVAVLTVPWWLRLARELGEERRERIVETERAEIAAHLHDSVLQTLALIQRQNDQPREVLRLARGQERELRH